MSERVWLKKKKQHRHAKKKKKKMSTTTSTYSFGITLAEAICYVSADDGEPARCQVTEDWELVTAPPLLPKKTTTLCPCGSDEAGLAKHSSWCVVEAEEL